MIDEILLEAEDHMGKSLNATRTDFSHVRAGRASTTLLDGIRVDYYGTPTPINQVANLATPEPRLITIAPWEKTMIPEIEKAIQAANLGVNPVNDGNVIRIPIPALTEERRGELARQVKDLAEQGRVAVRNVRRGGIDKARQAQKAQDITEDDLKLLSNKIQKLTDRFIGDIDEALEAKISEIMEV